MERSLEDRVIACERANARQRKIILAETLLWPLVAVLLAGGTALANRQPAAPQSLTLRELSIVDGAGVVRARLGGDLPLARNAEGRVFKRPKTAGLLIYDEQGIERGGYVTQAPESEAMLTLDNKYQQSALFVADPDKDGATALMLWRPGSGIELRSDATGSRLSAKDASGIILQLPALTTLPASVCGQYRELERLYPKEGICRSRYGDVACRKCLDGG